MQQKGVSYYAVLIGTLLLLGVAGTVHASPVLHVNPGNITLDPGQVQECTLSLDRVPDGLSRYQLIVSLSEPGIAEIVGINFPRWAGLNSRGRLPADFVQITGADINNRVKPGDRHVELATIRIRGEATGLSALALAQWIFEDESGVAFLIDPVHGNISVSQAFSGVNETPGAEYPGPDPDATPLPGTEVPPLVGPCDENPGTLPSPECVVVMDDGQARFTVMCADPASGTNVSRIWDFGDGSPGESEQSVIHTYPAPGPYLVNLTVCGCSGCTSRELEVSSTGEQSAQPLSADFIANTSSGSPPLAVCFTDLSTGDPASWYWDFGDGENTTDQNPVHVFLTPGNFTVSLLVRYENRSDTREKQDYISVLPSLPVGSEIGYIRIYCNVEGAGVYLDGVFQGRIVQGSLLIPVYVTGTPPRSYEVRAGGYIPYMGGISCRPGENETCNLHVILIPQLFDDRTFREYLSGNTMRPDRSPQWPDG